MRATLASDASYCQHTGASAWGGWAIADGQPSFSTGGAFTKPMASSGEAEICAIANMLYATHRRGYLKPDMVLMIQSDCQGALSQVMAAVPFCRDNPVLPVIGLSKRQAKKSKPVRVVPAKKKPREGSQSAEALAVIARVAAASGIRLEVRHVRGHKGQLGGRHAVNHICDRIAFSAMKAARTGVPA